jgi:two-component system, OmpR family, sensor histidine kinase CssS
MKKIRLGTQINIVFSLVTVLSGIVFFIVSGLLFDDFKKEQNELQLQYYFVEVKSDIGQHVPSEFNGYIIIENQNLKSYNVRIFEDHLTTNEVVTKFQNWPGIGNFPPYEEIEGNTYYFLVERRFDGTMIIVFTDDAYTQQIGASFNAFIRISFLSILLLGNLIVLLWSKITVDRVKHLSHEVEGLVRNNYQVPIRTDGDDEITDLAKTIESMRQAIEKNDKTKQEMLQNISHDFKTPIAVIQSYAEAILDGVSEIKEAEVIVKQADLLNIKVKQLLELNKLEYLKSPDEFEHIKIKEIITNIVNNQKYRTDINFKLDLDNSTYFAIKENLYNAFNNIIDNAIRYAKSEIVIQLKNKRLTFYNDGEPIHQKFIDQLFHPYEKGQKGQFGLGMSIAQKTVTHFNLTLTVENIDEGVMFIIEPL